ncbi:hypothetical protein L596_002085 [Steinernema carpocapsae]|uniref:Inhibitor of growth protein N-terminal histone-binding domain-containing protein n=1 Tax=Steinernema carpocapsae TaxID=34508 RepID=A0A4U8UQT3_STECR|nr:hypothetical protein L596_002085 [Steinernema carpocapsae]
MFLDDYIENLDNVPLEVRERFQEIRKLDDENKQALEDYEHRCNEYLVRTAKSGSAAEKDEARKRIEMIAAGMRERSKEKIRLADKMHAIMKKNEEHLSKEAESFRCELEADNPGAARLIEHRFGLAMSNYKPLRNEKKKRGRKPGPANRTVLSGANNLPNDIFRFNGIDAIDDYSNGAWNLQNGRMENGHHGRDENVPVSRLSSSSTAMNRFNRKAQ